MTGLLLRDVEVAGRRVGCRIAGGRVTAIAPDLAAAQGDHVVDGAGGALLPGFADHHLHLLATAAIATSVDLSPSGSISALRGLPGTGWLRVVGARDELRRVDIDAVLADRPVRVQHRSGALWTLNSAAVAELGLHGDEAVSGQLWRADDRLRRLLGPAALPDLASLSRRLLGLGITHVTDASPDLDAAAASSLTSAMAQRLLLLGAPSGPGPAKLVISDHSPPGLTELIAAVRRWHDRGRGIALHCVTQTTLALAIAALTATGTVRGDRIEHAAVCDDGAAAELAALGVIVVTQPTLLTARGDDYVRHAEPAERPWLWRYAGLIRAGVRVAVSSDAPYGDLNPWATLRAARDRRTLSGAVIGPHERVTVRTALRTMITPLTDPAGRPRHVARGAAADLLLLRGPLAEACADPDAGLVRATILGGRAHWTDHRDC